MFPGPGRSWITSRPRAKVIVSTKWEAKTTKKNRVASTAMVLKIVGALRPGVFDLAAKNIIRENARKSCTRDMLVYVISNAL